MCISNAFVNELEKENIIISQVFRKDSWNIIADKGHKILECSCKCLKESIILNIRTRKQSSIYRSRIVIDKESGDANCVSTVNSKKEPEAEWGIRYQAVGFALRVIANLIGKPINLEYESYFPIEDNIIEELLKECS